MNLPSVIKEIVLTTGSLVVPGLGRLYTKHHPAQMDKRRNVLIPPTYDIQFDERDVPDDGKLAAYLQSRYGFNETTALQTISNYVKSLKDVLSEKTSASIEGIGKLEVRENQLAFQSHATSHPLTDLLPSIEIPESLKKVPPGTKKVIPEPVPVTDYKPTKRKLLVPVAVVIIIASLAAVLYFTDIGDAILRRVAVQSTENAASFDDNNKIMFGKPPGGRDSLQEVISRKLDEKTSQRNALSYTEPETEQGTKPDNQQQQETVIADEPGAESPAGPYHIIAGSFHVPGNAEKFKSRLEKQGFHPVILPHVNTYHMVSLGSYQSLGAAKKALEEFVSKLDTRLWILKI